MFIIIDGKKIELAAPDTVLNVAEKNGINIPSLCYDKRFPHYTSCFICVVKDLKTGKLIPSCSSAIYDGMEISTNSEEISKYRKLALELLLSEHDADCFSPCKTSCPAGIDARDYILLAKHKDSLGGFLRVREKNPLVATVGRVCPAFCEKDCNRGYIEDDKHSSVAIRLIKRGLADPVYQDMQDKLLDKERSLIKKIKEPKRIAIVGGGPAGLTCAYYLLLGGYKPVIYDENKELGGMLRYSIPEYRLPREILNKEINSILSLGAELVLGVKVDKDKLGELKDSYDDVIVCTGTWNESGLGLGEERYENVYSALSFLKRVSMGQEVTKGKKAVVIGGGNSAIDAARTLLRLGYTDVGLYYRRTREQMPANAEEVEDALKEGVTLTELVAPVELNGKSIRFNVMELSCELDSSGRKKVCGTDKNIDVELDILVYAIGQKADKELLSGTGLIVCGDAKDGATTVIEAVADARRTAFALMGELSNELSFISKRQDGVLPKLVSSYAHSELNRPVKREPKNSISDFSEAELGLTPLSCIKESERCVNCGCGAIEDCSLRELSIVYGSDPLRFKDKLGSTGSKSTFMDHSTGFLEQEQSKCIKCGICVRVCKDVAGVSAISFLGRGFTSKIASGPEVSVNDSACILCGMCIDSCPTGALLENTDGIIRTDIKEEIRDCDQCILKCKIRYGYSNGNVFRARSYDTPICSIGRWGRQAYRGVQTLSGLDLSSFNVQGSDALKKADLVVCLDYDPWKDNPRVAYELKILMERGVEVKVSSGLDGVDLSLAKYPVVIFSYFAPPKLRDLKLFPVIIPVYYRY